MFEGNINLLSSYDTTDKVNTSSIESRKLTTGILKSRESKDYYLRLWLDYNTTLEDLNNEIKSFKSKIIVVGKPINYTGDVVFDFDYTGDIQTFTAPVSGTYKLETWGAQGGGGIGTLKDSGGLGGYSLGIIKTNNNSLLYLSVGGKGQSISDTNKEIISLGGYNGGGNGARGYNFKYYVGAGGGGATSVQNLLISDGQLKNYENNKSNIIIVSGGGGGLSGYHWMAGSGGGFRGSNSQEVAAMNNDYIYKWGGNSIGATQSTGYALGIDQSASDKKLCGGYGCEGNGGGGSGYYGGFSSTNDGYFSNDSGAGGSGYIGNSLLTNKVMYCYNCEESSEESTKTISTTCNEETPTSYCAKKGNGYARITLVSID